MLAEFETVEVVARCTDPVEAIAQVKSLRPDVLFLDIQMPEFSGFDLLAQLGPEQPLVVFTTAYDQYALKAFEVNSVDYLLKPVERPQLERALRKLDRMLAGESPRPQLDQLIKQVSAALQQRGEAVERIASRVGERVHFLDLSTITHFYAEDKLTFAAANGKSWVIDKTIAELEQRLDARQFCRVHRSTLVNLTYVHELYPWFGGKMILRLRDARGTEITVARERLKELKERLGL